MLQIVGEAVFGKFSFDAIARTTRTVSVRIAALDHKAFDNAVKDQAVIKFFFDKADKVAYRVGRGFRIELGFYDITVLHGNRDNRIFHN